MARITRRRRTTCKLACAIVQSGRQRSPGRIVTISEGGLAVITDVNFEQGDPIRLLIKPDGSKAVPVCAIIWNDQSAGSAVATSRLQRFGCVVSDPSPSYLELLGRIAPPPHRAEPVPIAKSQPRDQESDWAEPDLPRSREIQPPPKPEPEENWPYFRVRMKQIGGPRTRILTVCARSATQAESRAQEALAEACDASEGWGVLHIARVSSGRSALPPPG